MSFEHAPDKRRGYYTSWTLSGTVGGQVIAPAVVLPLAALLTEEQLLSWGWRIPFLLSAIVVLVGYLIRRTLHETPAFEAEEDEGTVPTVPLKILFRDHWKGVLRVFFAAFIAATGTLFSVFGLAFATGSVYGIGISRTSMLWLAIVSNFIAIFTIPMFAALSDRIGRKKVFISGIIGCALSLSLFFWSVTTGNLVLIFATGIKLLPALRRNALGAATAFGVAGLTFVAIGFVRVPLFVVLAGVGGLSCAWAWTRLRP
jgi:MFS family permease